MDDRPVNHPSHDKRIARVMLVLLTTALLSAITVALHVNILGLDYLETGNQIKRHLYVMRGTAGNPWQYRILAEYLVEGLLRLYHVLQIPRSIAVAFISFRLVQNALIFGAAYAYYRRLGLPYGHALVGISILGWGMTHAYYDSDLQLNTYFDLLFYLVAGLCIIERRLGLLIPVALLAALNRETAGLIPFMLLTTWLASENKGQRRQTALVGLIALGLYATVFWGLRAIYPSQGAVLPYGHRPGLDLAAYNLLRPVTWVQLGATLGILPVLAIMAYRKWVAPLRVFFWVIVPIWLLVHLFSSVMAETRLLLVPQALVFVPGALFFLQRTTSTAIPDRH